MLSRRGIPLGWFALVVFLPLLLLTGCGQNSPTTERGGENTDGKPADETPPTLNSGNLDLVNEDVIAGWAWDSTKPNTPIMVDIFDGNKKLDTIAADKLREDVRSTTNDNGKHGFEYLIPESLKESLKDGQPHSISVKNSDTNQPLNGSPKSFTFKK